jgi:adenosylhomocysteine nucleosidase
MAIADSPTVPTWLVVAADKREFDGIREQFGKGVPLPWPEAKFAREVLDHGVRWWLVANGPGPRLVKKALVRQRNVSGVISTGYCGALDPSLRIGDIVVSGEAPSTNQPFVQGKIHSVDRVAVTAKEKKELWNATKAVAVEMEAAAVAEKAAEWGVPFRCVRVVSDDAGEDLPLDFNEIRDEAGRFALHRVALQAIARPFNMIPALLRLDRNCRYAGKKLGVFFADCRF